MNESAGVTDAVAAATVVLLRDGEAGVETLMLHRSSTLAFAGGAWVFPGGRVDLGDIDPARPTDELSSARNAAAREAREEADLSLDTGAFVPLSRWCPPPEAPRRFNTWFFLAAAPPGEVTIDMGEIHDHQWISPQDAMTRRHRGEIELFPPTWVTLHELCRFDDVATALSVVATEEPELFITRVGRSAEGRRVIMWAGDTGYEDGDLTREGPRHRLWLDPTGWRYERNHR